jgi:N-acetylmuramoyl-L-alanine amidase
MVRSGSSAARLGGLVLAVAACTAEAPPASVAPAAPDDGAEAEALLRDGARLPARAEVVAITDRLAIAASRGKDTPEAPRLALLAARLRERVWRLDRSATDAREALELYATVVEGAAGDAQACEADLRRARLAGELERDAGRLYRELFLARERQGAVAGDGDALDGCLGRLERMLEQCEPFRPNGEALAALRREATESAASLARITPPAATASATADASASPGTELPAFGGREVLVVPDAKMVKDEPVALRDVQPYSWELGGRVVLTLSAPALYDAGMLAPDAGAGRGHRLYLDIKGARIKKKEKTIEAGGLVERVRLGRRNDGTRVVLDLSREVYRRVFYLPDPFRIVIDVGTRDPAAAAAAPPPGGKRSVRRVTLDPGHGGWDGGAVGPTGLREKDVALDVAHRAAPALAAELGVETMLTRDTDVFVDLEERTARANAFQSDLFVSIHCNATENGEAEGVEIYFLDPSRELDRQALGAVARENWGARRGKTLDPSALDAQINSIVAGMSPRQTTDQSRVLADLLRKATLASLQTRFPGTHDHGVKTAGFYVLVGADMPAVLFETAFISNSDDEARLATADYRQKLADAVVNAVRAFQDGVR